LALSEDLEPEKRCANAVAAYIRMYKAILAVVYLTGPTTGQNDPPAIGPVKMLKRYTLTLLLLSLLFTAVAFTARQVLPHDFFGIIEYRPSTFLESSEKPFFFSIGRRVKFANSISENAPTVFEAGLFSGHIDNVYPSPDETRAVVESGGRLYIVDQGKAARLIFTPTANFFGEKIDHGDIFYRTPTLQWSADSRSIFIARDRKNKISNFSSDATLVRATLDDSITISDVIPDFRSWHYVVFGNDVICFDYAPGNGSVVWRCSQKGKVMAVKSLDQERIALEDSTAITGKPFVSYYRNIIYGNENLSLTFFGFSFKNTGDGYEGFFAKGGTNPIFKIRTGANIKGLTVDGVLMEKCIVLPGGRFALIDVHHDNFKGQLLVDGYTGAYRELPRETRVYSSLNSWRYNSFQLTIDHGPEFFPITWLRAKEACEKRSGETCKMFGGTWWSQTQYGENKHSAVALILSGCSSRARGDGGLSPIGRHSRKCLKLPQPA
jgi:hypothetical protein